ncbi:DUF2631 domain-containing protein [Antrihabitans sp. YC2-6]|uniref:DUF2631 domain-containing protein n=1 Tax=Antrihabitans sp. YC2-6 TaxID=2799498 RepID=UPI0018F343F9|nr:DUF2631 domain-containing protein [Antrihabitans sp. YC2-6]MBJ8343275.1 DUF2631 domain-containing protein [Antrihabitans sp. YC2-6]
MAGTELEQAKKVKATVDTVEVPSAEWGWSGEAPRFFRFMGWFVAVALLTMIIGNHTGRVEDLYLVGFSAAIVVILIRDIVRRRRDT